MTGPEAYATVSGTVRSPPAPATTSPSPACGSSSTASRSAPKTPTAPFEASWNTTALANGSHVLTAVARDAAGHETTAPAVTVTVTNDTTAPDVAVTGPASVIR